MDCRVGQGFDVHGFEAGKTMRLGGITIPSDFGLKGHSDGDAVLHALCDALLGAVGLGDIGEYFPDNDPNYHNSDSGLFVGEVLKKIKPLDYAISNVDITVIAEKPRLKNHKTEMRSRIAELLEIDVNRVNIKATTMEKFSFIGREEGLAAMVVVLLSR